MTSPWKSDSVATEASFSADQTLALTAGAAGLRQSVGDAVRVQISSATTGYFYYLWTDATAAIAVSSTNGTPVEVTVPTVLVVPATKPYFEFIRASGDIAFTLSLEN